MHTTPTTNAAFKRQVVFRISPDEWPLLEAAATTHGSLQAAILAGLHALNTPANTPTPAHETDEARDSANRAPTPDPQPSAAPLNLDQQLRAREAAQLLGLKTSTIAGYIRTGKLPGHYDDTPLRPNSLACRGWITTRRAVEDYRQHLLRPIQPPTDATPGVQKHNR